MIFINRKNELKNLNDLWHRQPAQFIVIYGKRRVGKTELIKQFLKNKKGIYFMADKRSNREQLRELGLNEQTKEIIFGEVKWSKNQVGMDIYQDLKAKAKAVPWHLGERKEYYILFGKKGFSKELKEIAKKEKIFLVEKDRLIS